MRLCRHAMCTIIIEFIIYYTSHARARERKRNQYATPTIQSVVQVRNEASFYYYTFGNHDGVRAAYAS